MIIGFVVALGLAGVSPPQGKAREQANQARQPQQPAAQVAAAPKADDPERLYAACHQGEANRDSDLCAQWYAADSAYEASIWTRRTGWITGVGLLVGAITMGAAIAAALFARDAADHTKRSADIAEDNLTLFITSQDGTLSPRANGYSTPHTDHLAEVPVAIDFAVIHPPGKRVNLAVKESRWGVFDASDYNSPFPFPLDGPIMIPLHGWEGRYISGYAVYDSLSRRDRRCYFCFRIEKPHMMPQAPMGPHIRADVSVVERKGWPPET